MIHNLIQMELQTNTHYKVCILLTVSLEVLQYYHKYISQCTTPEFHHILIQEVKT